ncbi:MAG TPA: cbb3-type cytochrome oxidase assembly protein CcoS [Gemmatimonadales bacterium]|jgi:cbb3-type cytochrome oxidase maturation protein|nr:cbb3-type cytochrome oxidase assembly protein CcoS [Gemmatimonadales bacterium]
MNAYLFIIPLALILGGIFVGFFLHAAKSGQFDDLEDPPRRMLKDD